jgi:hypothetical protein
VPTGGLLDAAAALVQSIAGQAHDVERVHHRTASGSSSLVAVLKPVNPSIATTSALGQHRVVRGVPRHAEALGDPSDGQVLTHDAF